MDNQTSKHEYINQVERKRKSRKYGSESISQIDPFENPLPPLPLNTQLNFSLGNPLKYNNNYDYLGGTYYKADPYQFYNGDFDIIIENAADLDTDEADESDQFDKERAGYFDYNKYEEQVISFEEQYELMMKEQLGGIFNEYVMYRNNKFSSNEDFKPIKTEKVILNQEAESQIVIRDSFENKNNFNIEDASDTFVNIHNNTLREYEILSFFLNRNNQSSQQKEMNKVLDDQYQLNHIQLTENEENNFDMKSKVIQTGIQTTQNTEDCDIQILIGYDQPSQSNQQNNLKAQQAIVEKDKFKSMDIIAIQNEIQVQQQLEGELQIIGINTGLFTNLENDQNNIQQFEEEIILVDNLFSSESTENSDINLSSEEEQESDAETSYSQSQNNNEITDKKPLSSQNQRQNVEIQQSLKYDEQPIPIQKEQNNSFDSIIKADIPVTLHGSLEQLEEISKLKTNQSPIKIENNQNDSINEVLEENSSNDNHYENQSSLNDLKQNLTKSFMKKRQDNQIKGTGKISNLKNQQYHGYYNNKSHNNNQQKNLFSNNQNHNQLKESLAQIYGIKDFQSNHYQSIGKQTVHEQSPVGSLTKQDQNSSLTRKPIQSNNQRKGGDHSQSSVIRRNGAGMTRVTENVSLSSILVAQESYGKISNNVNSVERRSAKPNFVPQTNQKDRQAISQQRIQEDLKLYGIQRAQNEEPAIQKGTSNNEGRSQVGRISLAGTGPSIAVNQSGSIIISHRKSKITAVPATAESVKRKEISNHYLIKQSSIGTTSNYKNASITRASGFESKKSCQQIIQSVMSFNNYSQNAAINQKNRQYFPGKSHYQQFGADKKIRIIETAKIDERLYRQNIPIGSSSEENSPNANKIAGTIVNGNAQQQSIQQNSNKINSLINRPIFSSGGGAPSGALLSKQISRQNALMNPPLSSYQNRKNIYAPQRSSFLQKPNQFQKNGVNLIQNETLNLQSQMSVPEQVDNQKINGIQNQKKINHHIPGTAGAVNRSRVGLPKIQGIPQQPQKQQFYINEILNSNPHNMRGPSIV